MHYVTYKKFQYDEVTLRDSTAVGPNEAFVVPELLLRNILPLAESITENQTSDYGKLWAIRNYRRWR